MLYYYIVLYYNNLNIQHMKNIKKLPFILSILSFLTFFIPANAEIKVVATIKPIHSLASNTLWNSPPDKSPKFLSFR